MPNIIIVPEIYDEWPEIIEDCWVSISMDHVRNRYVAKIIKNNDYQAKTVCNFLNYIPNDDEVGKVEWYEEEGNAYIVFAELDKSLVGQNIGKWFFVLLRTHVARTLGHKIVPPKVGTVEYINKTLIDIAKKYNEETLEIRTISGEVKPFSQVSEEEI